MNDGGVLAPFGVEHHDDFRDGVVLDRPVLVFDFHVVLVHRCDEAAHDVVVATLKDDITHVGVELGVENEEFVRQLLRPIPA